MYILTKCTPEKDKYKTNIFVSLWSTPIIPEESRIT